MFLLIIFVLLILALDITAMRWGFDSRDKIENVEREYMYQNIRAEKK